MNTCTQRATAGWNSQGSRGTKKRHTCCQLSKLFLGLALMLLGCNSETTEQAKLDTASATAPLTEPTKPTGSNHAAGQEGIDSGAADSFDMSAAVPANTDENTDASKPAANTDDSTPADAAVDDLGQGNSGQNGLDQAGKGAGEPPPFSEFEMLAAMEVGFASVDALEFAPDGRTMVTCGDLPKIWELGGTEPVHEFEGIYPLSGTIVEPEAVAISDDGKWLAFAGGDGMIFVFDYHSRESIHEIEAHESGVVSLSFSTDRKRLASSSYDGTAKVWNAETGELMATCEVQQERRVRSAIAPDGSFLATAGQEAEIWDPSTGEKKMKLDIGEPRAVGVWSVDVSDDGKLIVTGDATKDFENAAMIWSAESGKRMATMKHEFGVGHVDLSPDQQWLATGDMNGVVRIWRLADNKLVQEIKSEEVFSVEAIRWTPDSKVLAISSDGTIRFWGPPGALSLSEGSTEVESETEEPNATKEPAADTADPELMQPESEDTPVDASPPSASIEPTVPFDQVKPLSVSAAAKLFSAAEFPAPFDTAPGLYAGTNSAGFKITKPYDEVIVELEKTFAELNWEILDRAEPLEKNLSFQLRHGQLLITCTAREERDSVVRVDLSVVGNVDIRSIPKLNPKEVVNDQLSYSTYKTDSEFDEIMNHYDQVLAEAGWQKFTGFDSKVDSREDWRREQYRHAGISLNISANRYEGDTFASIFCQMLEQDVPTPAGVRKYELDDSLFRQRFHSNQSVEQLTRFFVDEMKDSGWTLPFGKAFSGSQAGMLFTRPDHDPVYLELWQQSEGETEAYMSRATRQVDRAVKDEFEVEYQDSKPLSETDMHSLDYRTIPFYNALNDGAGRTIAESVFFNTENSLEEIFEFYHEYFSTLGWEAGDRKNELIGDQLHRATVMLKKGDAQIEIAARPWNEGVNRVNIEGNGLWFPGARFCHMMARPTEATDIE